jgi:hypothetical protein
MGRTRPTTVAIPSALGVLLTLAAFGVVSPAGARAGCVYPHSAGGGGPAHFDLLALAGAPDVEGNEAPAAPPSPSPCAGLRCSGDPAAPLPSGTVAVPRAELWGCLMSPMPRETRPGFRRLLDDLDAHPSHGGPTTFRPPR